MLEVYLVCKECKQNIILYSLLPTTEDFLCEVCKEKLKKMNENKVKEFEDIKNLGQMGSRSNDDGRQYYYSIYYKIRESFPINQVPIKIEDHIDSIEEQILKIESSIDELLQAVIDELRRLN